MYDSMCLCCVIDELYRGERSEGVSSRTCRPYDERKNYTRYDHVVSLSPSLSSNQTPHPIATQTCIAPATARPPEKPKFDLAAAPPAVAPQKYITSPPNLRLRGTLPVSPAVNKAGSEMRSL